MEPGPGSEALHNDCDETASVARQQTGLKRKRSLEGQIASKRSYENIVTHDNARVHNGDHHGNQYHHYYYARPNDAPDTRAAEKDRTNKLLESLSFPRQDYRFRTIEPAYQETCRWLFKTPEYTRWRDPGLRQVHHRILWVKGKPGAGKSTITKCALEHANATYPGERNIHFFFNARGDKLEKCSEGMYRSLLHQLAPEVPSVLQTFGHGAVEAYARAGWPVELLRSLFRSAILELAAQAPLNCYIDALDEGEDEDQMRDMVSFFGELAETANSTNIGFSVYFASRHYPNISIKYSEGVVLDEYEGHRRDIGSYVQNKLSCRQPLLKAELVADIIKRSSGIFLWVVLVVRRLNTESDRGNQHLLKTSLQNVPRGLNDLFEEIVRDRDGDKCLLPTLLWVLFSKRPMSPLELYFAVTSCTNPDSSSSVVWDHTMADATSMKLFITSSSKGLLEVVTQRRSNFNVMRPWHIKFREAKQEHNFVVQFIHESVREYLRESGLQRLDPSLKNNLVGSSNLRLAQWCRSYLELSFRPRVVPQLKKTGIERPGLLLWHLAEAVPFSPYALVEILHHSEEAAWHGLDVPIPFEDYVQAHLSLSAAYSDQWEQSESHAQQTVLHVLAKAGCANLILKLLERYNETARRRYINLRVEDGHEHSPAALHFAAREMRLSVVEVLLRSGADVEVRDKNGTTPLLLAIRFGTTEMVDTILTYGADANVRDNDGTALLAAVHRGNVETFEALMRYGADINARFGNDPTPLEFAATHVNLTMVKAIIASAPDMKAKDRDGYTSLHCALRADLGRPESLEILHILLRHGADINVRCLGEPPLLTAVTTNDHHAMEHVQVLLDYRPDVNASDASGRTALHAAASRGAVVTINLLLGNGADANASDKTGRTALHEAVRRGAIDTVKLLMSNGANVNASDETGRTALHEAGCGGWVEITHLLLGYGANANAGDGTGSTALHEVFKVEVINLLLEHGADVNAADKIGRTALHQASRAEVINLLLEHGADVNASDKDGGTALHNAVRYQQVRRINSLLEHNVDLKARDKQGNTPLILAIKHDCRASVEISEILLWKGADVNAADSLSNTTPLSHAVRTENVELIKILLTYGADVHGQKSGWSIMKRAKWTGNPDILQLLTYFADIPPHKRLEAAHALGHQEWWKKVGDREPSLSPRVTRGRRRRRNRDTMVSWAENRDTLPSCALPASAENQRTVTR